MMCAVCSATVERKLSSLEGVNAVSVSLSSRTAWVDYNPEVITPEQMKTELSAIGYDMVIEADRSTEEIEHRTMVLLRRKVILSWVFALLTMSISMGWIHIGNRDVSNQTMLIIALANLVYCGRQFYVNAWQQVRHLSAGMDTLVALSTCVSFLFSAFNTFMGEQVWGNRSIEWHTYFDASVMIITFVLSGRLLEERAKNSTASAIRALMGLAPKTARVVNFDGTVDEVPVSTLAQGDVIEVAAGQKIPVDGKVSDQKPQASNLKPLNVKIDESMISGEPAPVEKQVGDKVFAGTIVKEGTLRFRAEAVGEKTVLANIIRMVQQAQNSKAPVQRTVDRVALIFVPAVLCLSLLTFIVWFIVGGQPALPRAILSAVSVLVIACPCAMGLATPTALMVGIGKAAQRNILIKDATALEQIRRINALVIDKTGTLTEIIDEQDTECETQENTSLHVGAVHPCPPERAAASPTNEDNQDQTNPNAQPSTFNVQPSTFNVQRETLKPHAAEAISMLHDAGVEVYMMSGDVEEHARYWAEQAGIHHYQSRVMPQDKEDLVRRLQTEGKVVAMAGDGINDTQALAVADVSIAMGQGTDIAMDVAQMTLMGSDLRRIPEAVSLSRRTVGMIRQNLFWAFIYNIICIPLAAGVLRIFGIDFQITPMWASALMAFSSVSVVLNSLRLKFSKIVHEQ